MKRQIIAWLALLTAALPALAHDPVIPLLNCWREATEVVCEGRRSDGNPIRGGRYEVTDSQDKMLLSGQLDRSGRMRFVSPTEAFHVLLWNSRGVMAEAGWRDVHDQRARR